MEFFYLGLCLLGIAGSAVICRDELFTKEHTTPDTIRSWSWGIIGGIAAGIFITLCVRAATQL